MAEVVTQEYLVVGVKTMIQARRELVQPRVVREQAAIGLELVEQESIHRRLPRRDERVRRRVQRQDALQSQSANGSRKELRVLRWIRGIRGDARHHRTWG